MFFTPIHTFYIFDTMLLPTQESNLVEELHGNVLYEVVRAIDGVVLFWEDHQERFSKSVLRAEIPYKLNFSELRSQLYALLEKNHVYTGNIAIQLWTKESEFHLAISFISTNYPSEIMYRNGVYTLSYPIERRNPNIKQSEVNIDLRTQIRKLLDQPEIFEVLLVNKENEITEGSRTNVFFVKGDTVYTASSEKILEGISRKRVIEVCTNLGINIKYQPVYLADLVNFDAVFLTGTSPKVLPVIKIDTIGFNPENVVLRSILNEYNQAIRRYIKEQKPD